MLKVKIDADHALVILEPDGALTDNDFRLAAQLIDPVIEKNGSLKGLIVHTRSFPGWASFAALVSHLRFVREHHKSVKRIAFVTDSPVGSFAQSIGNHFINAQLRHFTFDEFEAARRWILFGE
ncbi:STAS/SEC14 domain-containing protein [Kangiella sp.]|uniref:STAS/SEC14 domain-containing protein n=1 Tax=Kangiella sp. TaxID=1920245 RepID=UPI003A9438E0